MVLSQCSKCRFKSDCENQNAIKAKLKETNLHIYKISFNCKKRGENLEDGRRVEVSLKRWEYSETGGSYLELPEPCWDFIGYDVVVGTIMQRKGLKYKIWLDEPIDRNFDDKQSTVVRVFPDRLKPLPDITEVCPECGKPRMFKREGWNCSVFGWDGESRGCSL